MLGRGGEGALGEAFMVCAICAPGDIVGGVWWRKVSLEERASLSMQSSMEKSASPSTANVCRYSLLITRY
jgi:phosphate-selective porin